MAEKITLGLIVMTDFPDFGRLAICRQFAGFFVEDGNFLFRSRDKDLRITLCCGARGKEDYEITLLDAVKKRLGEDFYEYLAERKGLRESLGLRSEIFTKLWEGDNKNPNDLRRRIIFGVFVSPLAVQKMKTNFGDGQIFPCKMEMYINYYVHIDAPLSEIFAMDKAFEILKPAMGDDEGMNEVVNKLTNGVGVYEVKPEKIYQMQPD